MCKSLKIKFLCQNYNLAFEILKFIILILLNYIYILYKTINKCYDNILKLYFILSWIHVYLFQITPQKVSEKCFWAVVQEENLASNDILQGLSEKFSSKPAKKKIEDSTDVYDII